MTKEKAIEIIERYKISDPASLYELDTNLACDMATRALKEIDSLKAEQPKHGHWIEQEGFDSDVYYDCSVCGESWVTVEGTPEDNGMIYCPHCGAKMDEPKAGEQE